MFRPYVLGCRVGLVFALCVSACAEAGSLEEGDVAPTRDGALWGEGPREKLHKVCGSGTYVHGIDVSKWQGAIDWPKVAASGVGFVFIRSTYGRTGVDNYFDANWKGARDAGLLRGAYHFFNPAYEGRVQAIHMLAQFDDAADLGELPIVLDVEERTEDPARDVYVARVKSFTDAIVELTGRPPMLYTGGSMWDQYLKSDAFAHLPVWVPHYFTDRSTAHCPNTPNAWARWTIWQHSEQGTVPGITGNVDLDVFDGTIADLRALTFHRAEVVSTSVPAGSTITISEGTCTDIAITVANTGGVAWDEGIELALVAPRDHAEPAIASPAWRTPSRVAAITGEVPVGGEQTLTVEVCGNATGRYALALGFVEDGITWFDDAMQGGPSEDALTFSIDVGAGELEVTDGGTTPPEEPEPETPIEPPHEGGRCSASPDTSSPALRFVMLALSGVLLGRRWRAKVAQSDAAIDNTADA